MPLEGIDVAGLAGDRDGGRTGGAGRHPELASTPQLAAWLVTRPGRYGRAVGLHAALHHRHRRARRPAGVHDDRPADRLRGAARSRATPVLRLWTLLLAMRWAWAVGARADRADRRRRAWAATLLAPVLLAAVALAVVLVGVVAVVGVALWGVLAVGGALRQALWPAAGADGR